MRFILDTARKDLRRIFRDPLHLMIWIAMPIIMTSLMALIFGSGDPAPQGKLLVDDQDKTFLSGFVSAAFSREPLNKMVMTEAVAYEAGRKRLDAGEASALLVIPKGFAQAFLRSEPVTLTLWTNPAQRILPNLIKESLAIVTEGGFYVQSFIGKDLKRYADAPPSDLDVARLGVETLRISRRVSAAINPPLIDLQMNVVEKEQEAEQSLAVLFFPGMLMLAIFGLSTSSSEDIWREKSNGAARRVLTTTQSLSAFLCGKMLALAIIFGGLASVGIAAGKLALGATIHAATPAVLWIVLSGISLYLFAALIQIFASEQRGGVILNGFIFMVLSMLGGSFFPFEVMPKWLASIGRYTPNGWIVQRFKEIIAGSLGAGDLLIYFATLCGFIVIVFALFSRRVARWAVC